MVSVGGPGLSNTAFSGLWLFRFESLLEHRDLLVIDHRGMGASAAIDCPGLQHGSGDLVVAARDCGAQLGSAAIATARAMSPRTSSRCGRRSGSRCSTTTDRPTAPSTYARTPTGTRRGCARRFSTRRTTRWTRRSCARYRRRPPGFRRSSAVGRPAAGGEPRSRRDAAVADQAATPPTRHGDGVERRRPGADGHCGREIAAEHPLQQPVCRPAFLNEGELTAAAEALRRQDAAPLLRLAAEAPLKPSTATPRACSRLARRTPSSAPTAGWPGTRTRPRRRARRSIRRR